MIRIERLIEQTNLKPTVVDRDIENLVSSAVEYGFFGICVSPFWVKKAKRDIGNLPIQLITVIGFPLGYNMTEVKIKEMDMAIEGGVDEIDLVMNISAFKSGMNWAKIEIAKCAQLAHENEKIIKVIIETACLTKDEIVRAAKICQDAGADFVKTSTGFAAHGARIEDVKLLRNSLASDVRIKASGGIETLEQVEAFITAGADRIGTSRGIEIMKSLKLVQK